MDAETINRKIHEWLGKCGFDPDANFPAVCAKCGEPNHRHKTPDCTTDLNAVREAELKCIEEFGDEAYMTALIEAQEDCEVDGWSGSKLFLVLIITPADKRAQAVCDVLEKGK